MVEQIIPTREKIIDLYPPKPETFKGKGGRQIYSEVSRDGGVIVHVVPRSTRYISPLNGDQAFEAEINQ